jgi:hypothetical protein
MQTFHREGKYDSAPTNESPILVLHRNGAPTSVPAVEDQCQLRYHDSDSDSDSPGAALAGRIAAVSGKQEKGPFAEGVRIMDTRFETAEKPTRRRRNRRSYRHHRRNGLRSLCRECVFASGFFLDFLDRCHHHPHLWPLRVKSIWVRSKSKLGRGDKRSVKVRRETPTSRTANATNRKSRASLEHLRVA